VRQFESLDRLDRVSCHYRSPAFRSGKKDEYINYDEKNARLICQESKRYIAVGETIRVRGVTLSLNEREPRDSKIGLTMRQPGLGTAKWLDEELAKEKEKEKEKGGERGSR